MKQEALEKLPEVRDELEAAVLDILEEEPEGVRTHRMRYRINEHPCSVNPSPKYIYVWLAALKRDDVIVIDTPNKRYLHPDHATEAPEVYRQNLHLPDSVKTDPTVVGEERAKRNRERLKQGE